MKSSITKAIQSGHGDAILYAGALGLLASDLIPTPADAVYFRLMAKNKEKLDKGEIDKKQYWTREAILYYSLNPIWWGLVLGTLYFTKGHYTKKLQYGVGLLAAGAVVAVLNKNIKETK